MDIPAGQWRGTVSTWFEPEGEPIVSDMTATTEAVLEGKSVRLDYQSQVNQHRSNGMMIFGKDIATLRPCLTWIDTFHTGGNVSNLAAGEDGAFLGAYAAGEEMWRWRITVQAGEELRIAHVNIHPSGQEDRAIEVILRRT
ncbi:MAG TPA: DUF1579 family protein [Thermoanaerobaculia bacterium]|nr:DUF1579 family protein [Thermoanaerobaculia bacterium]